MLSEKYNEQQTVKSDNSNIAEAVNSLTEQVKELTEVNKKIADKLVEKL